MAVVYNLAVRNARLQVVVNAIGAAGHLRLFDAASTVLADIVLATPCGVVAGGVLTFSTPQIDASANATGNAASGDITDSGGTVVISGLTAGSSAMDLFVSPINISLGDRVTFLSGTITGN